MNVYRHATADWREILIEDGSDSRVFAKITDQRASGYHSITLPADERQAAAQALAGDEYVVVPAEQTAPQPADRGHAMFRVDARCPRCAVAEQPDRPEPVVEGIRVGRVRPDTWAVEQATCVKCAWHSQNRPEPVDPASVRVGDVVEIKAPLWRIEGECIGHPDEDHLGVQVDRARSIRITDATVCILQAADEPEPDEAAVEALARALNAVGGHAPGWPDLVPSNREHYRARARALIRDHGVHVEVSE